MRLAFLGTLLLLSALLAGCGDGTRDREDAAKASQLDPAGIVLPEAGEPLLTTLGSVVAAVWNDTELPLVVNVTVPAGATMIRAVADSGATSLSMSNLATGRRRCNNAAIEDFSEDYAYPKSCSSVTALDEPGAVWRVAFNAPLPANGGDRVRGDVRVEYLDAPYDGLLAGLDLDAIDKPTRDLQDTVVEFIPSHDGVLLRTERTLPEGDGPFPAILVSSPYYDDGIRATPADWTYVVQDWAKRGYAMVTADVRGFGDSGGCVEVWGPNEQLDQKVLVEWVAAQPWSNGNVGFYGQSYVGTTPVEAAVQAPEALKAIVTVAPVINAYEDWHYGGVPNGESTGSPRAYQVETDAFRGDPTLVLDERFRNDPQQMVNNAKNGPCDPTLVARANDPRALYDQFYEERNFKLRAKDVKAAVLYTEGFEDANVKSSMIPGWFNELPAAKLGLFGHWLHQHPSRLDCEALFVGWFETHLKGKELGFDALPQVAVQVDRDTHRVADAWPPADPVVSTFGTAFSGTGGTLVAEGAGSGTATLELTPVGVQAVGVGAVELTATLASAVSLAGEGRVHVVGAFTGAGTGYVHAELWDGERLVTWGQFNLAHNADHTAYDAKGPGDRVEVDVPLRPTEHVFAAGATMRLVLDGLVGDPTDPTSLLAQSIEVDGAATRLVLGGAPLDAYTPIPLTARP